MTEVFRYDVGTCPWCNRKATGHVDLHEAERPPIHGDVSICLHCLGLSVYDLGPFGLLSRRPTVAEHAEIMSDNPDLISHALELRVDLPGILDA